MANQVLECFSSRILLNELTDFLGRTVIPLDPYHYSAVSQGQLYSPEYEGSYAQSSQSQLKGLQLYHNRNPSVPTTTTSSGLASTPSPVLRPAGRSNGQSPTVSEPERGVDGGRVPQEMLEGILPPAYGDQID